LEISKHTAVTHKNEYKKNVKANMVAKCDLNLFEKFKAHVRNQTFIGLNELTS
jgi:hypothetical protein